MASPELKVYTLAVCLFPNVTALDYQGPIELLSSFSTHVRDLAKQFNLGAYYEKAPNFVIEPIYLSHTLDPIKPLAGPRVVPDQTYESLKDQVDLILIPGGLTANVNMVDPSVVEFLKRQVPGAKHVLTVCTGSWLLAGTGLLDGQRATTNKAYYKIVAEDMKDRPITWVPKARWVVNDDKKIWTSSGVTAGMDQANAFLEYFTSKEWAQVIRNMVELGIKDEDDDEFAAVHGLVSA
ncbi:class I glutamine amidotransferase-like protein [Mycena floridula]|nr:class I glutamine amidotransferase-like protein [Mycena floridula]